MSRHPLVKRVNRWSRRLHRWGAIATLLPLGLIVATGLILQLKKDWSWVQPPAQRGVGGEPAASFADILEAVRGVELAQVRTWDDVDRLDVRPGRGMVKVRTNSRWEVQVDLSTAEVLQVAYRRSDLIETLHDGSFFGNAVKLGVFLPTALVLLGLWATGAYLWILPYWARWRARAIRAERAARLRGR